MRLIEIEQVRSPIRRPGNQRSTLIGLGLNRIGRVKWVPDTPQFRATIKKVSHLVRINNDPAATIPPRVARVENEAADAALMRELAFDVNNITLESYSDAERNKGKTPDFKLFKEANLRGFCEMKSPGDDFVFARPEDGVAIRKNLPFYRKLGSHVRYAALQFHAVNPDRILPNILAFVTHSSEIQRRDLIATIAGLPVRDGRRVFMLGRKMQEQVMNAARKVDLFLWIDAQKRTCEHLSAAGAPHQAAALDLLGLANKVAP
jgi:ribosomal protein L30